MSKEDESKKAIEAKAKKLLDYLPKSEDEKGDDELIGKLIDRDGKVKVDLKMPSIYRDEIMAELMVAALTNYERDRQAIRSARNSGDNQRAELLFKQMSYNRLLVAIIQAEYPKVKALADEIMEEKAVLVQRNRAMGRELEGNKID